MNDHLTPQDPEQPISPDSYPANTILPPRHEHLNHQRIHPGESPYPSNEQTRYPYPSSAEEFIASSPHFPPSPGFPSPGRGSSSIGSDNSHPGMIPGYQPSSPNPQRDPRSSETHGDYRYGPSPSGQLRDLNHDQQDRIPTKILATLYLNDGSCRSYQLATGSNIIGRAQDAHFRLPDTGVSRRHLNINWNGQIAFLSDLNSTNGTIVNSTPVQEWQLADGDVIRIGHSEIIIHIQ